MTSDHSHHVVKNLIKIFSMQFDPLCQIQWTNHFFLKNQMNIVCIVENQSILLFISIYIEGNWAKVNLFEKYHWKPVCQEFLFVCLLFMCEVGFKANWIHLLYSTQCNAVCNCQTPARWVIISFYFNKLFNIELFQNFIKSFFDSGFLLVNVSKGE